MRLMWCGFVLIGISSVLNAAEVVTGYATVDSERIRKDQGVAHLVPSREALHQLRIVVIGPSFDGFMEKSGQLPSTAIRYQDFPQFPEEYRDSLTADETAVFRFDKEFDEPSAHDLQLAMGHWAMMGKPEAGPQYALVEAQTPHEINRALSFANWWDAKFVLIAFNNPTWGDRSSGGSRYAYFEKYLKDPTHFIIAAAGNDEGNSHTATLRLDGEKRVVFENGNPYLRLKMGVDGIVRIVTVWDKALQDFDLYILNEDRQTVYKYEKRRKDEKGSIVTLEEEAFSERRQGTTDEAGDAILPYESLTVPLKQNTENGYYYIEVRSRGGELSEGQDEIRVVVRAADVKVGEVNKPGRALPVPAMKLVDWTPGKNTYFPTNFKGNISVGEQIATSSHGPTLDGRTTPTVLLPPISVDFTDGQQQSGTSPASVVVFGGIMALLACEYPGLTRDRMNLYIATLSPPSPKNQSIVDISKNFSAHFPALREQFPPVFTYLEGTRMNFRRLGRNALDLYVFGYDVSPAQFENLFQDVPSTAGAEYEYYLAYNREGYFTPYTRKATTDSLGEEEDYPWNRSDSPDKDYRRYIELRQVWRIGERGASDGRVFVLPSSSHGQRYFGEI